MKREEAIRTLEGLERALNYTESQIELYEKRGQFIITQIAEIKTHLEDLRSKVKKMKELIKA